MIAAMMELHIGRVLLSLSLTPSRGKMKSMMDEIRIENPWINPITGLGKISARLPKYGAIIRGPITMKSPNGVNLRMSHS